MQPTIIAKSILLTITAGFLFQQPTHGIVYIESWRKGTHQIKEQSLCIELNARRPEYEALIRDEAGKPGYKLSLWPGYVSERKSGIVEWMVELVDISQRNNTNLLKRSNDRGQDYFTAEDRIGWLYPLENPKSKNAEADVVPFLAKRVIKIESFYCIIEVKDYRFSRTKSGMLDSITVQVQFTNTYRPTGEN